MDKLTLYDVMSYFLPGVAGTFLLKQLLPASWIWFTDVSEAEIILLTGIISLLFGLLIHRTTFWLIRYKWYTSVMMPSIRDIITSDKGNMKALFKRIHADSNYSGLNEDRLFDTAYYYLEYHGKIDAAKGFQSMYFFIRNLLTLSICLFLVYMCMLIISCQIKYLWLMILCILYCPVAAWTGRFFRAKMTERIINTFYIAIEDQDKKNDHAAAEKDD